MNDNQIIDKGWEKMKMALDQKMPIESLDRKPAYYLYALLTILFLLISVGIFYYSSGFQNTNSTKPIPKTNDSIKYQIAQNINYANVKNANLKNDFARDIVEYKTERKHFENNLKENKSTARTNQVISLNNKKTAKPIAINDNEISLTTRNYSDLADRNTFSRIFDEKILTNKMQLLEIQKRHISIEDFKPGYFERVEIKKQPKFMHSLAIHLISENGQSFGGMEIAGLVKTKLLGKLYLSSGLNVNFLTKSGMQNSFFKTYNIKDPLLNFNTRFMRIEEYNANFNSPVLRSKFVKDLCYVGIPVLLNLDFNNLELDLGVKMSYMISGTNYYNDYNDLDRYNYLLKSSDIFYKAGIYNKLDYGMLFGVNYYFSNKIAISWKFDYSLSWIINSPSYQSDKLSQGLLIYKHNEENRYDKNVYFSLGLKYNLN